MLPLVAMHNCVTPLLATQVANCRVKFCTARRTGFGGQESAPVSGYAFLIRTTLTRLRVKLSRRHKIWLPLMKPKTRSRTQKLQLVGKCSSTAQPRAFVRPRPEYGVSQCHYLKRSLQHLLREYFIHQSLIGEADMQVIIAPPICPFISPNGI